MDFTAQSKQLQNLLDLKWPPIAITFRESAPGGISRIEATAPSGCTYWKLAAEGRVFYTEAADHYGCPIGAYTHGINLPPAQGKELEGMIETMVGLSYLRAEEVAAIPRRDSAFGVAIYAPLSQTPYYPDVILVRGNAKQIMLIAEAANAAGLAAGSSIMGRPTCAAVPEVIKSGHSTMSLGCIGNRVYNELGDDELYCALDGSSITLLLDNLVATIRANLELEKFHAGRKAGF